MNALRLSGLMLLILLNESLHFLLRLVYVPLFLADTALAGLTVKLGEEAAALISKGKQSTSQTPKDN